MRSLLPKTPLLSGQRSLLPKTYQVRDHFYQRLPLLSGQRSLLPKTPLLSGQRSLLPKTASLIRSKVTSTKDCLSYQVRGHFYQRLPLLSGQISLLLGHFYQRLPLLSGQISDALRYPLL